MDTKRTKEILDNFKEKRIAIVGDIMIDRYLYGIVERLNPERAGYPLFKVLKEECRLGGVANVAANISSLGAKAILFCLTGKDRHSNKFRDLCKKNSIELKEFIEGETIIKQRRIEKTHNDYLGREDFGEVGIKPITDKASSYLLKQIIKSKPDMIILSDYNKRVFKTNISEKIIDWAKTNNTPVISAPKPKNSLKFKGSTIFCPNLSEAKEIVSEHYKGEDVREIAKIIKNMTQASYITITCGSKGILVYDGSFKEIPTKAKEVVDVTGAGDTVAAAMSLAFVSGADISEAAKIANYAAGIVVEKSGTATTTREEIIKVIEEDNNINT